MKVQEVVLRVVAKSAGLVKRQPRRGGHRKRGTRRPLPGMLIHDASPPTLNPKYHVSAGVSFEMKQASLVWARCLLHHIKAYGKTKRSRAGATRSWAAAASGCSALYASQGWPWKRLI